VTLVPTGPLTNIAMLLQRHPDVVDDIERIVLMGGAIAEGNVTPAAEFNIWVDPEAAARVFASGLDVTMVGLDVTHRALLTAAHADRLRAAGRVGTMVAELRDFYQRFHSQVYAFPGTPVHDAVAVAHVIRGDLLRTEHRNVEIECASELCRGRTVVDLWRRSGREPNAHVAVDIDGEGFLELFIGRLAALG
jgi:inosine-uridine nucleoside N-ribohydrolase